MAKPDSFCNRAEAYEAHDNVPLSPADRRHDRRHHPATLSAAATVMRGTLGVVAAAALFGPAHSRAGTRPARRTRRIASTLRRSRPASTRPIMSPRATRPTSCSDGATRSFPTRPPSIRLQAKRRRAIEAVRLQQRLRRLHPARRRGKRSRPALRQSRIYQRGDHVPGHRPPGLDLLSRHDGGARRYRDGGAWRHHRRDRAEGRPVAPGARQQIQPPHQSRRHGDDASTGRRLATSG